jgi:hypothetical protein
MAGYKEPGFQDRIAAAAKARERALARLKAKPAVDPAVLAERAAKAREREAAQAQRAALRAEARQLAKAEKAAATTPEPTVAEPAKAEPTEAERKAERDARYAARKARK